MADALLLSTVVSTGEALVLAANPKLAYPGLSPFGVSACRQYSASLATFALISYYAREEKRDSSAHVVAARAGAVYHTCAGLWTLYNAFSHTPFFGYNPDNTSGVNTAIGAVTAIVHLGIAGLLYGEGSRPRPNH